MERPDRRDGEPVRFAAGASAARGYIITGAALAVGLFVMFMAFDGADSSVIAEVESGPETSAVLEPEAAESEEVSPDSPSETSQGIEGSGGADPTNSEDVLPPAAAEAEVPETAAAAALRAPQELMVLVLNSRAGKGAAGRVTEKLRQQGYQSNEPANAARLVPSAIYYVDGFGPEAEQLAKFLGVGSELAVPLDPADMPIDDAGGANLLVVVTSAGPITG